MEFKVIAQSIEQDSYIVQLNNLFYLINLHHLEQEPFSSETPQMFTRFVEFQNVTEVPQKHQQIILEQLMKVSEGAE